MFTEESLRMISEHVGYIKGSTNVGVVVFPARREIYLIDTANDDESIRRIVEFLEARHGGFRIVAAMNTHSHADHCGGNDWLVSNRGTQIWCPAGEASLMEYPAIETALIWGGTPIHDIRSKFLLAKPCIVDYVLKAPFTLETEDSGAFPEIPGGGTEIRVTPVPLPGHYLNQCGFLIDDTDGRRSFFLGDAVSGRNVLKKYWIQYLLDESKSKESIEKLSKIGADAYIPGHGDAVSEIEGLAELNLLAILETENMILDILKEPKTAEEILKEVADRNQIPMRVSQFVLIGSTIRSYLSGLYEEGRISYSIEENRMLWRASGND